MRPLSRILSALVVALAAACAPALVASRDDSPFKQLTQAERIAAIRRADVWAPASVASMDLRAGPQGDGAYAPFATVPCQYNADPPSGSSAKFMCDVAQGDEVKVKYGDENVEVFAEVAASRLLWALGFGTDRWYPVTVVCRGCPRDPHRSTRDREESVTFDVAAIERKMPGKLMESKPDQGWSWKELDVMDESRAAEERPQRDALKLLAVFLQHTDSKPQQQRMVCPPGDRAPGGAPVCTDPVMFIHDSGLTFGRANFSNANEASGANFDRWASVPIWKDPQRCVGKLSGSFTGTLTDPVISEAGRTFLAGLLAQLSDTQLRDLFEVARFDRHSRASIDDWVNLFKKKREEIAAVTCPS